MDRIKYFLKLSVVRENLIDGHVSQNRVIITRQKEKENLAQAVEEMRLIADFWGSPV